MWTPTLRFPFGAPHCRLKRSKLWLKSKSSVMCTVVQLPKWTWIQCGAPINEIAKLVNITPTAMVCDTYNSSIHGPINHLIIGGRHVVDFQEMTVRPTFVFRRWFVATETLLTSTNGGVPKWGYPNRWMFFFFRGTSMNKHGWFGGTDLGTPI